MITPKLTSLSVSDVNALSGLSLCMAFAIWVEKWKWYDQQAHKQGFVLIDKKPEKKLNIDILRHIGSEHYVFRALPKFHRDLKRMIKIAKSINSADGQYYYMRFLEAQLHTSNHFALAHASSEARCRALLKYHIWQRIRERKKLERDNKDTSNEETK